MVRQAIGDDSARRRGQIDLTGAGNLCTREQNQRVGGHGREGVFADLDAGVLRDRMLVTAVNDRGGLRGHMRGGLRTRDNRQRDTVATIETAGSGLQIERRELGTLAVEIERPRGVERVGQMLAGEHGSAAAPIEMQGCIRGPE